MLPNSHGTSAVEYQRRLWRFTNMIASVITAIGIAWLAGLLWYAADSRAFIIEIGTFTDAIVVLTGGNIRAKTGISLLQADYSRQLFISGVHVSVDLTELMHSIDEISDDPTKQIALGYTADDTSGNAAETAVWMHMRGCASLRLVTADYHMKRSILEFQRAMPWVKIVPHPVFPPVFKQEERWHRLYTTVLTATEYTKYLLSLIHYWITDKHR